jgi:hypothetical protein
VPWHPAADPRCQRIGLPCGAKRTLSKSTLTAAIMVAADEAGRGGETDFGASIPGSRQIFICFACDHPAATNVGIKIIYGLTPGGPRDTGGAVRPRFAGLPFPRSFRGSHYPRPLVTVDAYVQAPGHLEVFTVGWVGHRAKSRAAARAGNFAECGLLPR